MLDRDDKLQEIFRTEDEDTIAERINGALNSTIRTY